MAWKHAMTEPFDATPLIRKLETIFVLSDDEKNALQSISGTVKTFDARQDIVREGDRPSACCLLLEGFLCRYKLTDDGKRQILSFHIAGDIPDLQSLYLDVMDHSMGTLARSTLAFLPHDTVRDLIRRCPRIGDAFWRETLIDASIFREWVINLGRREAYARMAHLLCEIYLRLKSMGLANGHAYELPLTQAELGDALGASTVHVNRTLQDLRGEGLITFEAGSVTVLDWRRLKEAGEFDPTYLHLRQDAA
jgi:CRP-like cAMP-binding protein